jgi:hypothetical protein
MSVQAVFGLSVLLSFVASGVVAKLYCVPKLRMKRREDAYRGKYREAAGCGSHRVNAFNKGGVALYLTDAAPEVVGIEYFAHRTHRSHLPCPDIVERL